MPSSPHCKVCNLAHTDREQLERLAVGGATHTSLARRFNISRWSVDRHMNLDRGHVTAKERADLTAGPLKMHELVERAAAEGLTLLDHITLMRSSFQELHFAAKEAGMFQIAKGFGDSVTRILRLWAEVT